MFAGSFEAPHSSLSIQLNKDEKVVANQEQSKPYNMYT